MGTLNLVDMDGHLMIKCISHSRYNLTAIIYDDDLLSEKNIQVVARVTCTLQTITLKRVAF